MPITPPTTTDKIAEPELTRNEADELQGYAEEIVEAIGRAEEGLDAAQEWIKAARSVIDNLLPNARDEIDEYVRALDEIEGEITSIDLFSAQRNADDAVTELDYVDTASEDGDEDEGDDAEEADSGP